MSEGISTLEGQFFVPTWAQDHLLFGPDQPWAALPKAGVRLYTRAPALTEQAVAGIKTIDDLDAHPGWLPITGNLTSKSYDQEMGDLFLKSVTSSDDTQRLSLVKGDGTSALLEDGCGWEITSGLPGTEQEVVVVAAMYLDGVYGGALNPVLFVSNQGLGGSSLLLGGAMYGMTHYRADITPSVLTNRAISDSRASVNRIARHGYSYTLYTDSAHGYEIDDLVRLTNWTGADVFVTATRVMAVLDEHSFQAYVFDFSASDFDFMVVDFPGTIIETDRITNDLHPGTVLLDTPSPAYEPNNVAHVWLRPQRMNLIANPKLQGDFGWKSGTVAGRTITESNLFPVRDNKFMSISLLMNGTGVVRVGVVAWDTYYATPIFIHMPDVELTYDEDEPTSVYGLIPTLPGSVEYNLRIEWTPGDGPDLTLLQAMVDPTDGQPGYFDGNTNDSLLGDYHWHGGLENRHFSMWYNNRRNTESRLFGGNAPEDDFYQDGLLNEWTPSSSGVIPHWDAIEGSPVSGWSGDYFYPIKDVEGDDILEFPWQEFNERLVPSDPRALTDFLGGIIRTEDGASITLDFGTTDDSVFLTEDGAPILTEDNNYLLVP